ncbi:hypothetical protein COMA2_130006 [Candidatus Nitrospira nitrificans]|uniref:Uncharacterized protein n=1 Tax=Candidatus Nitrospira nitrificans TaxID=1742973 RepID=A0A0S4L7X6_9BACT|nr:hypothetical protein COMA2_130006 [Candidatus Nitrospira nitrificans]
MSWFSPANRDFDPDPSSFVPTVGHDVVLDLPVAFRDMCDGLSKFVERLGWSHRQHSYHLLRRRD